LVGELEFAARGYDIDLTETAGKFYKAVENVIGIIKPGIEAMKSLFEWEVVKPLGPIARLFVDRLLDVVEELAFVATDYQGPALDVAQTFYDTVEDIIGIIKPAIEAITAMLEYKGGDIPKAMARFKADLAIMLGPEGLPNITTYMLENVSVANNFKTAASAIVDALNEGMDMFTGLTSTAAGGRLADLREWHNTVMHYVGQVTERFYKMLSEAPDGLVPALWWAKNQIHWAIEGMRPDFENLLGWLQDLEDADVGVLTPGSPPPLATALRDVRRELVMLQQASQPVYAVPQTTTNQINLDFSGAQINNGMDMAMFQARVLQTVHGAMNRR